MRVMIIRLEERVKHNWKIGSQETEHKIDDSNGLILQQLGNINSDKNATKIIHE